MAPLERDRQFHLRTTAEEVSMLHALADKAGLSASDYIRQHIRREYLAAFGDKPPKKKPSK